MLQVSHVTHDRGHNTHTHIVGQQERIWWGKKSYLGTCETDANGFCEGKVVSERTDNQTWMTRKVIETPSATCLTFKPRNWASEQNVFYWVARERVERKAKPLQSSGQSLNHMVTRRKENDSQQWVAISGDNHCIDLSTGFVSSQSITGDDSNVNLLWINVTEPSVSTA